MAEGEKLFTLYPKMLEKLSVFFKKRWFFFETFWWKHRMTFWKPLKNLYDKSLKNLARSLNMIKDQKFFLRIFYLKTVLMTGRKRFPQLYQVFLATSQRICWFSETVKKTHNFLRLSTFLRNVSVKHGKKCWQPRRKISDIKPNISGSTSERDMKDPSFSKS